MSHNPSFTSPSSAGTILTSLINDESVSVPMCTPVYSDAPGGFKKALGDGSAKAVVVGLVADRLIPAGQLGAILSAGILIAPAANWDAVCGTSGGLTFGTKYYLSTTVAGTLTTSSASGVIVLLGVSATIGLITLASGGGGTVTASTNYIDVTTAPYSADKTGVTNAGPAIASALAAAITAGKDISIPAGTYKVTSLITIPAVAGSLKIFGVGAAVLSYDSTVLNCFVTSANSTRITFENLSFVGANNDAKYTNLFSPILLADNTTDTTVQRCYFYQVSSPCEAQDSGNSARLKFLNNKVINCANGVHPPSHSLIQGNDFYCTAVVSTRGQAVYIYGQFVDITIDNNRFTNIAEEDIQIRSTQPRWSTKHQFTITNNSFENSNQYSIWVGSDDFPNIGGFLIANNRFRNVSAPIQCQGAENAIIENNLAEWDWENPLGAGAGNTAITVIGGVGTGGHWNNTRGCIIRGNKLIQRAPWFNTFTFTATPVDGDTVTCGDSTYTWRVTPHSAADGEINIPTSTPLANNLRDCAAALVLAIQGADGIQSAPSNAIRVITDAMNNLYGNVYGTNDYQKVVIIGGSSFVTNVTGSAGTWNAGGITQGQLSCGIPMTVNYTIGTIIRDNHFEDFYAAPQFTHNYGLDVDGLVIAQSGNATGIPSTLLSATANVKSRYGRGIRHEVQNELVAPRPGGLITCTDAFPIVECSIGNVQLAPPDMLGRFGTVTVGDTKAYSYLYYGAEIGGDLSSPATLLWRWNDGDEVYLQNNAGGTSLSCKFKRTSPTGSQFNTAASLVAAINTNGNWTAAFAAVTDDFSVGNPNLTIKIKASLSTGVTGNTDQLWVERYEKPTSTNFTKAQRTTQPLTVGVILRNRQQAFNYALLAGGAATKVKTWVMTPLANPQRGVSVSGIDSTSQALAPVVYQADIVAGCGFTITHGTAAGTESFTWRLG